MALNIGFLLFPQVQQLDLTGPYEFLAALRGTRMHLIWKTLDPVVSSTGLILTPNVDFANCPQLDLICVPGGVGINVLLEDAEAIDFVKRQAGQARYVTSVCTGALLLGAAGLLRGRKATTHWNFRDLLPRFGAIETEGRVVQDGNLITAGGVTAGIDFGLTIVAELAGSEEAETIQLGLEYNPEPPFNAGTPKTASASVLAAARQRGAASRQARQAILARIAP
ncbi:MAG: DJ-1/PfpI family protein [Beijerinckiaceae bacterium]|nr:MAG: DJ-1/PfpI family protein [Beijerinckiaceae bacterium]